MFLTYNALTRENPVFDERKVVQHIILCRHSSKQDIVQKNKLALFRLMNRVIIKNVDNFFFLTRNYKREILHTNDDIVGECYVIMDKCISNFDFIKFKSFHWFLNTALSRALLRLAEKTYKISSNRPKKVSQDNYSCYLEIPENFIFSIKDERILGHEENGANFIEYYIETLQLDTLEKVVLESKLLRERVDDFILTNPQINRNLYYKALQSIKNKIQEIKECTEQF